MVKSCVLVKVCSSESYRDCGVSFHQFPKDVHLKKKWMEAIGREITTKAPVICSRHFKMEDYKSVTGMLGAFVRRLKDNAVPSLLLTNNDASISKIPKETMSDEVVLVDMEVIEDEKPLLACRGCLASSRPLRPLERALAALYGDLVGPNVSPSDILPKFVCGYCRALLLKFKAFRDKCLSVQNTFLRIANSGIPINQDVIESSAALTPYPDLQLSVTQHSSYIPLPNTETENVTKQQHIKSETFNNSESSNKSNEPTSSFNQNQSLRMLVIPDDLKPVLPAVPYLNDHDYHEPLDDSSNDENDLTIADRRKLLVNKRKAQKDSESQEKESSGNYLEKIKLEAIQKKTVTQKSCGRSKIISKNQSEEILFNQSENNTRKYNLEKHYERLRENNEKTLNVKYVYLSKKEQINEVISRKSSMRYKLAVFKCDLCYRGFWMELAYKNHMTLHDPSHGDELCDVCQMRFSTGRMLKEHYNRRHRYNLVCNECGHVTKTPAHASLHYKKHRGVQYPCKICGKVYRTRSRVFVHMKEAHKRMAALACALCHDKFLEPHGLRVHMLRVHKEAKDAVCDGCNVQFHSRAALQRHRPDASSCDQTLRPCAVCGESFPNDQLLHEHKREQHTNKFTCTQCGKTFHMKNKYNRHIINHNAFKRTKLLEQRNNNALKRTKLLEQRNKKLGRKQDQVYVCEICGFGVKNSKHALEQHRRTHTGEKLFQCDICHKRFSAKHSLVNHIGKHMGVVPKTYACQFCNRLFNYHGNRDRHERAVHQNIRRFQCEICDKRFQTKCGMQDHVNHTHQGVPWPKRVRKRDSDFNNKVYIIVKSMNSRRN